MRLGSAAQVSIGVCLAAVSAELNSALGIVIAALCLLLGLWTPPWERRP